MSDEGAVQPAGWFKPAAIAAVLFEIVGCAMCAMQSSVDPAVLEPDQRLMWEAAPAWMLVAYVVAVTVGLVGAVMLVMRKAVSENLLLVSFIAVLVQYSALLIVPALRNLTDSEDLFLPFVIALITYGVWQLARTARKRFWLR